MIEPGAAISTKRESSLIHEMKGRRYPEMKLAFWIGNNIFSIRFHHGTSMIMAASSISGESCIMELAPLLEAKGRNLIPPTMINSHIEERRKEKVFVYETLRYTAPKLMAGIRYGKKAIFETQRANLEPLFLAEA